MGLLDSALGMIQQGSQGGGGIASAAMALLQGGGNAQGLQGVLQAFREKGLGEAVASWISTGPNQPIGADDVVGALGADRVASIAKSTGLSTADASAQLAELLPQLVDRLTPGGHLPEGGALEQGLALLRGKLGP